MSSNRDYNDGWQDGYWFGSGDAYSRGYEEGKRAERDHIKQAANSGSSLPADESLTLGSMIGGSIILAIFGWCFVGLVMLLFWIGGESGSWWFPWIWKIAFWGGIGFVVVMSVAGVAGAIIEHWQKKKTPENLSDASRSHKV